MPSEGEFQRQLSPLLAEDLLDFARCSARLQALVVSQVCRDRRRRDQLLQLNPGIATGLSADREALAEQVSCNARVVREKYSLESSGMRLQQVYQSVLESPRHEPRNPPHASAILDALLSLPRFQPIRTD